MPDWSVEVTNTPQLFVKWITLLLPIRCYNSQPCNNAVLIAPSLCPVRPGMRVSRRNFLIIASVDVTINFWLTWNKLRGILSVAVDSCFDWTWSSSNLTLDVGRCTVSWNFDQFGWIKEQCTYFFNGSTVTRWNGTALHPPPVQCNLYPQISTAKAKRIALVRDKISGHYYIWTSLDEWKDSIQVLPCQLLYFSCLSFTYQYIFVLENKLVLNIL